MTEHTGTVERQLEKLRRDFGDVFLAALADPETVEIMLNPDGTLWQERLGEKPVQIGSMTRAKAESVLRTIAACVQTTITREKPTIECELPLDGSRFAGQIPPVVPAPAFAVRKRASRVFSLDQYVRAGILTPEEKEFLCGAIRAHRNILVVGGTGGGKAQPDDALVLTPSGFRRMDSLNVGDLVTCPDGTEVPIRGVYPQGEKEVYRIEFEDGRSVESCNDHLWKVWTRKSSYVKGSGRNGKKLRTVGWRTAPLSEVRGWLERKRTLYKRTAVPLVAPYAIGRRQKNLPIPPYVLGCLLGDGGLSQGNVKFTTADPEILDRILSDLPAYRVVSTGGNRGLDYRLQLKVRAKYSPLRVALADLGLMGKCSHEKFIPEIYKRSNGYQQLALLQGLLDTEGSVGQHGTHATFTTTSERLAKDLQEIAWSLGAIAKLGVRQTFYTGTQGDRRAGRPSYRLSIVHPTVGRMFLLPRKLASVRPKTICDRLRITRIVKIGVKLCRCISVDHPEGLYITNNYVVTHNTTFVNALIGEATAQFPAERLIIVEDTGELQCAAANYVQYHTSPECDMTHLVRTTLRMRPDRILVGEVRGPEALDLLMAWNTGHEGGVATVHANNAVAGLARMVTLVSMNAKAPRSIEPLIGEAVDVLVHIERKDGGAGRIVREVLVVEKWDATRGEYVFSGIT